MKKITLLFALLLVSLVGNAQDFRWAKQISGTSGVFDVQFKKAISLKNGDLYVCGSFSGTIDFDPGTGVTNRTSQGKDGFVAKYFSNGNLAWVTSTNSAGNEEIVTLATSHNPAQGETYQAVVVVGNNAFKFIRLNPLYGNINMTSTLYSSTGTVTIGNMYENGNDMVLVGSFTGTLTLGSTNILVSAGMSDGFYMYQENNLTSYLTPSIVKRHGGANNEFFYDVALQSNTIVGSFEGTTSLGNPAVNYTSNGGKDGLLMRVNFSTGEVSDISVFGGIGDDEVTSISKFAASSSSFLVIGGYFSDTVDFDPSTGVSNLISSGGKDGFVAYYNFRTLQFANKIGNANDDYVSSVAAKGGYLSYTANIGTSTGSDMQIGSFYNTGLPFAFGGYYSSTGNGNNMVTTIENYTYPSVYVIGNFNKPTDFDTGGGTTVLTPVSGGTNSFIQKYSTCSSPLNAPIFITTPIPSTICNGGSSLLSIVRISPLEANDEYSWYAAPGANNFTGGTFIGTGTTITVSPTTTTSYYPLQTGCVGTGNNFGGVTVTVSASNAPSNATIQTGTTITATETSATYQWLDCYNGGQVIAGATNQSFTPTYSGAFAVRVTKLGCPITSTCVDFMMPLSTDDFSKLNIKLYPNPVKNSFTIEGETTIEKLSVYNLLGQQVKTFTNTNTFNIEDLNTGTYLVEITTEKGTAHTKIVKE